MLKRTLKWMLTGAMVVTLAACGSANRSATAERDSVPVVAGSTTSSASGYGVVQSVEAVPREQGGLGVGTATGAVVGGVLGNQVGSGRGRAAATVAGAAGGAMVGRQMQRNSQDAERQVQHVSVRMDNGSVQNLTQEAPASLQVGERVRLANGVIVERFR